MKILTLNMHKGFTSFNRKFILHELREAIRGSGADLVCLQEVLGDHQEHSTRYEAWPAGPQYEFLADTIWSNFAYGQNAVYPAGHHGNALLSKFPILRHQNHDVSTHDHERRGLLHSVLEIPSSGTELHVICTHLGLTGGQRMKQLNLLCDLIERDIPASDPVLVAGDFNDWREKAHALLQERVGLQEVFIKAYGKAARTFPVQFPLLRLDRVYVRNLEVSHPEAHTGAPWSHLSDHAPLSLELQL
ncbi:endonuclease/exonuclease/phosphatase family protein [Abyssibacter sp.]|uniref:endonuclease/exonuclease/phosphatase family protein n=1 Tax=Abyssibacter sp. TaxID=2320200 RepID=UPI0025BD3065|nr:endonuclease/exonuclease/phosphatase family protein [Abyssibacter sp.]MCK5859251.1 endonuclease/exonuclease/phosphatase family protein [Abyssibacter sp.]